MVILILLTTVTGNRREVKSIKTGGPARASAMLTHGKVRIGSYPNGLDAPAQDTDLVLRAGLIRRPWARIEDDANR